MTARLDWSPDAARQAAETAAEMQRVTERAREEGRQQERTRVLTIITAHMTHADRITATLIDDIESGKEPSR